MIKIAPTSGLVKEETPMIRATVTCFARSANQECGCDGGVCDLRHRRTPVGARNR